MPDHQNKLENNVFMDFIAFNEAHPFSQQLQPAYYQLGLMCCVQALPELLDLEEWLPYLWQEGMELSFSDQQQATEYAENVIKMVTEIQSIYQQGAPLMDLNCQEWQDPQQGPNNKAVAFATGFLNAVEVFNARWLAIESDEDAQQALQTTILLCTKLLPKEEADEQVLAIFEELPECDEILEVLPQLLTNLAYRVAKAFAVE